MTAADKDNTEKRNSTYEKKVMTLRKEVNVEKNGYEGKNRAEVGIRGKNVQGGTGQRGGTEQRFLW